MSEFDDLNEALAALKTEMEAATSASQAVARLGKAADSMSKHAATVEARIQACEERLAGIDKAIEKLGKKTTGQWEEAVVAVLGGFRTEYIDAVTSQIKESGDEFSGSVAALRAEWIQREEALKRARKWVWILSSVLAVIIAGIATAIALSMNG